jgi:Uma2 family endonuclease
MQLARPADLPPDLPWPLTEDDLPYSDGEPTESQRHVLQMTLLIESLTLAWADRPDGFVGGDMFLYFSPEQVRGRDFRGPDVFAVLDVPKRERKSWVVWQEGKGPDVIIELLSESTAAIDKGEKKRVYQDEVKVPEYFWYDPETGELAGFRLRDGVYEPIVPDSAGRLPCEVLDLALVRERGRYNDVEAVWLRWTTAGGALLPTSAEIAEQERRRAEAERRRAEAERRRAEAERRRAEAERRRAETAEAHLEEERRRADDARHRIAELEARLARLEARLDSADDAPR